MSWFAPHRNPDPHLAAATPGAPRSPGTSVDRVETCAAGSAIAEAGTSCPGSTNLAVFFTCLGLFLGVLFVYAVVVQLQVWRPGAVSVRDGSVRVRGGGRLDKRSYTAPFIHLDGTRSRLTFRCTAWRFTRPEPAIVDADGADRLVARRSAGAKAISVVRDDQIVTEIFPMHWKRTVAALEALGWTIDDVARPRRQPDLTPAWARPDRTDPRRAAGGRPPRT